MRDKNFRNRRRAFLAAGALAPWLGVQAAGSWAALETQSGGRLGLVLLEAGQVVVGYRAEEIFPACSTFKALLAAAVLDLSRTRPDLLLQRVHYAAADLKTYAPVTSRFMETGMTVEELCAAAVSYSDNVAANLLMGQIGGPSAVTAFARSLGDTTFRLDRWEPELNSAMPGDPRDTCTPLDMARNLQKLVLSDALPLHQRGLLKTWMVGNTTGDARIRAGVPLGWTVGDKTGTGEFGTTNDIAVLWPDAGKPRVLAVYFTQTAHDAKPAEQVIANASRLALALRS